jgi:hypothetical protein
MSLCRYIVLVAVILAITSCARTYQPRHVQGADFLNEYALLEESRESDALISYWKKGVNWRGYKRIILEPVIIKKTPDWELDEMTHADDYMLRELIDYRMQEALKQSYKLVSKPAADTLVMQFAVTDIKASTGFMNAFPATSSSVRVLSTLKQLVNGTEFFADKARIESKIIDSTTSEVLMAAAYARAGNKPLIGFINEWDDIEKANKFWAIQLGYQLCLRQARIICQKPHLE